MFRHIVLLTLKDDTTEAQRRQLLDGLATLPASIPTIRRYSYGVDAGINDGNSHIVAVGDFDDVEGYLVYRDHPAHRQVVERHILPVLASRAAVQYDLGDAG